MREAVESVLHQNFADFEIIIVDDGSTDDTSLVIERITDKRVKYFYKENGGVSSARNYGLLKAKGAYIAFLDSDDLWLEEYLKTMVFGLEENPEYGVAYSLFKNIYPNRKEKVGFGPERFFSGWITEEYYKKTPYILLSASLFRKGVLKDCLWDESLNTYEDIDIFLRVSAKAKFLYIPDGFVIRRITSDSLSQSNKPPVSPNSALVFERFYFHLGGDKLIQAKIAKRKISRLYRSLAKHHYKEGHRRAASLLFRKAIGYYPFDPQYYRGLLKSLLLKRSGDKMPNWKLPKLLPPHIMVAGMKNDWRSKCKSNNMVAKRLNLGCGRNIKQGWVKARKGIEQI